MEETGEKDVLRTQQHDILICKNHELPIDVSCEDCEEYICSTCVKNYHQDHEWMTISTAAYFVRKYLLQFLMRIKENSIRQIDNEIKMTAERMRQNKERCSTEVSRFQGSFERKFAIAKEVKSKLEEKKKKMLWYLKIMNENRGNMTDFDLLQSHRELIKVMRSDDNTEIPLFSMTYKNGDINEAMLESMIGQPFDCEQIHVTETDSFQWYDKPITILEEISMGTCLLGNDALEYVEEVSKSGKKEKEACIFATDICVTDTNVVLVSVGKNQSIACLFPSGKVYTNFSTDPLEPAGICQTVDDDLLVTLIDTDSDLYNPTLNSRRLIRLATVTGDLIREYEYTNDGQSKLFTAPARVKQNGNSDICVVNWISGFTAELLVLFFTGYLKFIYRGFNQRETFNPTSVVCDPHCNIILSEFNSSTIHLLNPDGMFMRYLLTDYEIDNPTVMCLKHSTLWIGNKHGVVKVFQYDS